MKILSDLRWSNPWPLLFAVLALAGVVRQLAFTDEMVADDVADGRLA